MLRSFSILLLLLAAATPRAQGSSPPAAGGPASLNPAHPGYTPVKNKKTKSRGNQDGNYDLTVAGHYTGAGTATVGTTVSLSATVKVGDATGTFTATDLVLDKGYFTGTGTIMGVACTIHGRVDLPAADDDEQNDKQAITARITGTFKDANGHVGRIVAVQKNPVAGGDDDDNGNNGNDKNNGNGANNGNGSGAGNGNGSGAGSGHGHWHSTNSAP